jgi:hypothetical protein
MEIYSEDLAYWFFRLNGFLSIVNFVVHSFRTGETGTDADILGVRFPYRAELFEQPMLDYPEFTKITNQPYISIAEVKRGLCNLNGPWTSPKRMNIQRVLRAIGAIPLNDIDIAAEYIYKQGYYDKHGYYISLVCVGETNNKDVFLKYPLVPQILWRDIKSFIYHRFTNYRRIKTWHQHWDENGIKLWDLVTNSHDEEEIIRNIELR